MIGTDGRSTGDSGPRSRALRALRQAFEVSRPDGILDGNGYLTNFRDNLLPLVELSEFVEDLRAGDGNELGTKFRAVHSSSALAVNCFAPFRSRVSDLKLPVGGPFSHLRFEAKCPTGIQSRQAPNLDVLLEGPDGVVGIESKLTEYFSSQNAEFSPAYVEQITDERRDQGYYREMLRLIEEPNAYRWLDAAQLIKHAFGLDWSFRRQQTTLLYLYWEPLNTNINERFDQHRAEVEEFSERVARAMPKFAAVSYPSLWASWDADAPSWLVAHLKNLAGRYLIEI